MNAEDVQFVKNKVDAELKVSDITRHIAVNGPVNGKGKGTSAMPSLVEYFKARMADPVALQKEGIQAAHVDHTLPTSITNFIDSLLSRARAEKHGGAFVNIPLQDPKERLQALARRADEKALQKETIQLELRGLKTELKKCRAAVNSKDAAAAAIAEITLKKLLERRIPDVEEALTKAVDAENDALRDLRNARTIPKLGGLQHVKHGSAEL